MMRDEVMGSVYISSKQHSLGVKVQGKYLYRLAAERGEAELDNAV